MRGSEMAFQGNSFINEDKGHISFFYLTGGVILYYIVQSLPVSSNDFKKIRLMGYFPCVTGNAENIFRRKE